MVQARMARPPMKPLERDMSKVSYQGFLTVADRYTRIRALRLKKKYGGVFNAFGASSDHNLRDKQ